jgi:hypothetical protein
VKEIPLRSGNEVKGIAFTLQTAVGARIFGKVSTASLNVPVQVPSRYFLLPTDRPSALAAPLTSYRNWASAANQLKGEFELRGIMPGNYDLYPVITGQVGYTAKVHITAGTADIHDVAVLIEPGVTVSGRLVSQDGPLQVGRLQITLQFKNNAAADFLSQVVRIQPPDRDGVFTMLNVPEGSYQIIVSQPERGYVADIREGAVSIFDAGLGVSNRPPAQIQIVLGRNGAAIAGYVRTSTQPAGDVTVTLVPEAARRGNSALYKTTKTANGTGRFVFNEVAPGAYKLFSWENAPPGAETSPEFIEKYEDRGAPVRVEARSDGRGPSIDNLQVQLIQQQQP